MPWLPSAARSGRARWTVFTLLVAIPAIGLSWLALRAIGADEIERKQRVRDQQIQLAGLADAAIANLLADLETSLRQVESGWPGRTDVAPSKLAGLAPALFDRSAVVAFPTDRVYFGEFGRRPATSQIAIAWPSEVEKLVQEAQAFEAQRRTAEARVVVASLRRTEPRLREWTDLVDARLRHQSGDPAALDRLTDTAWAKSAAITPAGLPTALIACTLAERVGSIDRPRFRPLLEATLQNLRAGRWWLSGDERRVYDAELRRLLEAVGATPVGIDDRLAKLDELHRLARQSPPYRRDTVTRTADSATSGPFLAIWLPSAAQADGWIGAVLPEDRLAPALDAVLGPLLDGQPSGAVLRDGRGQPIWTVGHAALATWHVHPIRAVTGWELAFTEPSAASWSRDQRFLWYAFIALLVVVLLFGLATTAQSVRQQMAFARMRSEFVGAVTHEFKSPITAIRLLLERVRSGRVDSPDAIADYQAAIARETDRLERLVNRLLAAQQVEAGRRRYEFAAVSIRDLVAQAAEHLRPHAEAVRIQIETRVADTVPDLVRLDESAMLDALENLLDNSIKYSPPATSIRIDVRRDSADLEIAVADEGIGIEPHELPRIFDRFYRARSGDVRNVRGTGLGLSLVKAVVEAHGGGVSVTSTTGAGTTFTLRLPSDRADGGTGNRRGDEDG